MPIVSHKDYCHGKPRVDGTRLWVSLIVLTVEESGVDGALEGYESLDEGSVREALDYCRKQRCQGKVVTYCVGCTKDPTEIHDAPEYGVHVLGDEPVVEALEDFDITDTVLAIGSEEELNRKRDLWPVAEAMFQEHFGSGS